MKLFELKEHLQNLKTIGFILPNGAVVPKHFHVTEVGKITKNFVDCGGTVRKEEVANLQLWNANDYDHRLHPKKLTEIIELSEKVLQLGNLDIEVEYQGETIEKFGLDFDGTNFLLTAKKTDCLAKDACGIPTEKTKKTWTNLPATENCCTPESGCC